MVNNKINQYRNQTMYYNNKAILNAAMYDISYKNITTI